MFKNKSFLWWLLIGWWLAIIYYFGIWWWLTAVKFIIKKMKEHNIRKNIHTHNSEIKSIDIFDNENEEYINVNADLSSSSDKQYKNISHSYDVPDYTVIDLETTGLSNKSDKIIEISAIRVRNNIVVDQFNTLINPGINIPKNITIMTGITNEMVKDAPKIEHVINNFINFVSDDIILGHNITFDINFINNIPKNINNQLKNNYIDTLTISRKKLPSLENHKLETLIKHYNISDNQSHRALSDCLATHKIYQKLISNTNRDYIDLPREIRPFFGITQAHIIKENENKLFYNVSEEHQKDIINLVLTVNKFVCEASKLVPEIKPFLMTEKDIIFLPKEYEIIYNKEFNLKSKEIHNATRIQEEVFTSLGNIKKHPFIIHFFSDKKYHYPKNGIAFADEVFGKIFFNIKGNLSRCEITHWNKSKLHTITCVLVEDKITVNRIFSYDKNGNKFIKYKRN